MAIEHTYADVVSKFKLEEPEGAKEFAEAVERFVLGYGTDSTARTDTEGD